MGVRDLGDVTLQNQIRICRAYCCPTANAVSEKKGTVDTANKETDKSSDSDERGRTQPNGGKHRLSTPPLSDTQLEELMARFRQRFGLTNG